MVLALLVATTAAADDGVFDTAGNPAALGLHLQVNYPGKWKVLTPKKGVLFAAGYGKDSVAEVLELQVGPMSPQEARSFFAVKAGPGKKVREKAVAHYFKKYSGLELVAFEDTVASGYPAIVVNLERHDEKSPQPLFMRVQKKMVYVDGKMVLQNYVVMARPENREKVLIRQEQGKAGDAGMFFGSLVFKESVPQKRQKSGRE